MLWPHFSPGHCSQVLGPSSSSWHFFSYLDLACRSVAAALRSDSELFEDRELRRPFPLLLMLGQGARMTLVAASPPPKDRVLRTRHTSSSSHIGMPLDLVGVIGKRPSKQGNSEICIFSCVYFFSRFEKKTERVSSMKCESAVEFLAQRLLDCGHQMRTAYHVNTEKRCRMRHEISVSTQFGIFGNLEVTTDASKNVMVALFLTRLLANAQG